MKDSGYRKQRREEWRRGTRPKQRERARGGKTDGGVRGILGYSQITSLCDRFMRRLNWARGLRGNQSQSWATGKESAYQWPVEGNRTPPEWPRDKAAHLCGFLQRTRAGNRYFFDINSNHSISFSVCSVVRLTQILVWPLQLHTKWTAASRRSASLRGWSASVWRLNSWCFSPTSVTKTFQSSTKRQR